MKKIILLVLILTAFVFSSYADQFQFMYQTGNETYIVSFSNIRITDTNNVVIFNAYTDNYGRITIELTNGSYAIQIFYQERWWNVQIIIDSGLELKPIYMVDA